MMNKIIVALLVTVLAFVVTVLVFNFRGVIVQDALINMFFMLITAELATMGGIKVTKTLNSKNKNDSNGAAG